MSSEDLWMRDVVAQYALAFFVVFFLIFCMVKKWPKFRETMYKAHLVGFEAECAELAVSHKEDLFKSLHEIVSHDQILRYMKTIRLLEIAVKTGENIQFYPEGTYLIAVDWNSKLEEYLTRGSSAWKFSHVHLERQIHGDGSSLKDIPTGCVDVVVTTRSLCSTKSLRSTLKEIHRVLTPGGKYFFMEHVPAKKGIFVRGLQILLSRSGIWPSLFGDCRLDVDPTKEIKNTGFAGVKLSSVTLEGYVSHPFKLLLSKNHVLGVATR